MISASFYERRDTPVQVFLPNLAAVRLLSIFMSQENLEAGHHARCVPKDQQGSSI